MCSAQRHVRFTPNSGHVRCNYGCPLWAKSGHKLFSPELMLLDGALKRFRRTFDPVIETIISLNRQYSNNLALPRTGTTERPLKIDNLTDGVASFARLLGFNAVQHEDRQVTILSLLQRAANPPSGVVRPRRTCHFRRGKPTPPRPLRRTNPCPSHRGCLACG